MQQKPISAKDVFMHLLSVIMLYASAISFMVVIFQIINLLMPDLLAEDYIHSYQIEGAYDLIRSGLAFLIITYPVYVISTWLIKKSYAKDAWKKEMFLRKWLVYFTLFVTALLIIGNLIALLIGFLYGGLTMAFALKVLTVFFVAGIVFGYYIVDLKNKYDKQLRFLFIFTSIVVLAAIIAGFFFVGSPANQRLRNIDQDKINDLESLDYSISSYYNNQKALPENITDFDDYKEAYQYTITDETHYQICTEFNFPSYGYEFSNKYDMTIPANTWEHDTGEICFTKKINPEYQSEFIR